MRALITGGAGFIGSHLAEFLLLHGHQVTVLDDLSTGSLDNVAHLRSTPAFECVVGSVMNDGLVEGLVKRSDVVFHLAAVVGVKLVVRAPIHTIDANVEGTANVLRHAGACRRPIIIASTSEVYGKGTALPFREDADLVLGAPHKCRWGYATSKLLDEFMALAYFKERGTPVTVVRLFNTVGPRQTSRYGMVIPTFVRHALASAPLIVHGDGSQTRSFTWVGDVVWALAALIQERRAWGQVFNIGNPEEISILELAHRVRAMTGSRSHIRFEPYDQAFDDTFEDMPRRVPDIGKLQRTIGYEPKVRLEGILHHVIDYWTARLEQAAPVAATARAATPWRSLWPPRTAAAALTAEA